MTDFGSKSIHSTPIPSARLRYSNKLTDQCSISRGGGVRLLLVLLVLLWVWVRLLLCETPAQLLKQESRVILSRLALI